MKAMILAAGLGTRLRPLTNDRPKALVEVNGQPMLQGLIEKLQMAGFDHLVINVHHYADLIRDFLTENNNFGMRIDISDESHMLLDTGGAIRFAEPLLKGDAPFLVHNVDVWSDIDIAALYKTHIKSGALATLAVRQRDTSRYLLFDDAGFLKGWQNKQTGEQKIPGGVMGEYNSLAFSGIHVVDPVLFNYLNETETGRFSIIDAYLRLSVSHNLQAYDHTQSRWLDLGRPEQIRYLETEYL